MDVEQWPVDKPVPYARNPRKNEAAIDKVASSLAEFGWQQPIVVDKDGIIVVGHTRLLAAKKLGHQQVPVQVAADLTPEQAKAYRLMDNRSHEDASWDIELLKLELDELKDLDLDLALTGFNDDELARLMRDVADGATDADEIPSDVEKRATLGDLWICGKHRLVIGDATSADDVARCLAGAVPEIMVTDPPYGVEYDAEWRWREGVNEEHGTGRRREVANDDRADWSEAWSLFPGDIVYCWSAAGDYQIKSGGALIASGFQIRNQIIWRKPHFPMSRGHYTYQHEPCWYAIRKGCKARWIGAKNASSVWEISLDATVSGGHSTQKPEEAMRRPLENHDVSAVYDPFLGSGTTMIAAERLGIACYGLEINPEYGDVILQRWENFTGEAATLVTADTSGS